MRDWPYFWQLTALGIASIVGQTAHLFWVVRWNRRSLPQPAPEWPTVFATAASLILPILVGALTSIGRGELLNDIVDLRGFHWETAPMTQEWNQRRILLLGTILSAPSILLAGIAAGSVASRRARRTIRILSHLLAPAIMVPLFSGIGLYLHRLVKVHFPTSLSQQERDSVLRGALAAAKDALDLGVLTAGLMLGASVVALVSLLVTCRAAGGDVPWRRRLAIPASILMLIVAGLLSRATGPMAAENRTPVPGHDHRTTLRVFPPVPVLAEREDLYRRSGRSSMGPHRDRLFFPLVAIAQEPLVRWSPMLKVFGDAVSVDGIVADSPQALRELLATAQNNERALRGDAQAALIAAMPDEPLSTVANALAVLHDSDSREVRLVTGLPETIIRPTLGALSRGVLQTTTVKLTRGEVDQPEAHQGMPLWKAGRTYRELIDRVLEAQHTSPPILLLEPDFPERAGR